MPINCVIVDDEQTAVDIIKEYIAELKELHLVASTTNALEVADLVQQHRIDIIFLDIQMPKLLGTDVAKMLNPQTKIVFTTAYTDYALESFNFNVLDFMVKPIAFTRFMQAIQKYKSLTAGTTGTDGDEADDFIIIKGDGKGKFIKLNVNDIDYVESLGQYQAIYVGGKKYLTLVTSKQLELKLPQTKFVRIHKSFIIATRKIASIEGNTVTLNGYNNAIDIGNTYKDNFLNRLRKNQIDD
jgi:two-component system, LytTR family, response regulator